MSELILLTDLRKLIIYIYKISSKFPDNERYNLVSQIRRASVSSCLNVREGNVFKNKKKVQYFEIALGSLHEVDECMIISESLKYVDNLDDFHKLYWICINKLNKLINSIPHKLRNSV